MTRSLPSRTPTVDPSASRTTSSENRTEPTPDTSRGGDGTDQWQYWDESPQSKAATSSVAELERPGPVREPVREPSSVPVPSPRATAVLHDGCVPLGSSEIATRLGVADQTVRVWRFRGVLPEPTWTLGGRPVWRTDVIDGWARETGRMKEVGR